MKAKKHNNYRRSVESQLSVKFAAISQVSVKISAHFSANRQFQNESLLS